MIIDNTQSFLRQTFAVSTETDSSSGPKTQVSVTSARPRPGPGEECESASQKVSITRASETVSEEENDFTRN